MSSSLQRVVALPTGLTMTLGISMSQALAAAPAIARLVIRGGRITPALLLVPADVPLVLMLRNEDATARLFTSRMLGMEKTIPGHCQSPVWLAPLIAGQYSFEIVARREGSDMAETIDDTGDLLIAQVTPQVIAQAGR
jgi:hypothetical protein